VEFRAHFASAPGSRAALRRPRNTFDLAWLPEPGETYDETFRQRLERSRHVRSVRLLACGSLERAVRGFDAMGGGMMDWMVTRSDR
jgi:hypothetical protein